MNTGPTQLQNEPSGGVFLQDLVFSPEMIQVSPDGLELGSISGSTLCYRTKGKSSKADSPVLMVDLVQGKGVGQFVADGLPLEANLAATNAVGSMKSGAGVLSPDRRTFACVKGKALFGSALRVIDIHSGNKAKSMSIDVGNDTISTWASSPGPDPTYTMIILADPYKRQIYTWPIAAISKSLPRKVCNFSMALPDGCISKLKDVTHFPGTRGGSDGGWVVLAEWMQWPLLKAMQGGFFAGMLRACRLTSSGALAGNVRDVWGHAGAFVDVPMGGNTWKTLFCYANRMNPKERMRLHYQDLDAPILQPGERHPSEPDAFQFSVSIPTYDATDVPIHVHVVPGSLIVVVTSSGALHAFTLEGELIQSSQIRLAPGRNVAISCFSSIDNQGQSHLYARTGQLVRRIAIQS